jgi:hypothetical protein
MSNGTELKRDLEKPPWYVSLAVDVVFLKSTPATAVVYALGWATGLLFLCLAFGIFARWGVAGFERAGEAARVRQQVQWLVGNDIEYFYAALCRLPDSIQREQVAEHYQRLQAEYKYIAGYEASTQPCPARVTQ